MRVHTKLEKLRKVWMAMVRRCTNADDPNYRNYGGRGIVVCSRWLEFNNFLADMGMPAPGLTLERIKNDQGYTPNNCRWATRKEQSRNRRVNRMITFQGESLCLMDWALKLGFSESFLRRRMDVQGMTFEQAITVPKRYKVWRHAKLASSEPCFFDVRGQADQAMLEAQSNA